MMSLNKLSTRESEIYRLLMSDLSYEQIAKKLYLTIATVKVHCANICKKRKASGRVELMGREITYMQKLLKESAEALRGLNEQNN